MNDFLMFREFLEGLVALAAFMLLEAFARGGVI